VTSDPGPGSNGFPLPPSYGPPSYGGTPYGPPTPAPYGQPPGYVPSPYGHAQYVQPNMLAAAADRERTIDVLKAAFGEGRLTKEEFDSRSGRVLAARTYADLAAIVADINREWGTNAPVYESVRADSPHVSRAGCIFYNPTFMEVFLRGETDEHGEPDKTSMIYAIMAHELGHIEHHDYERAGVSSVTKELDADRFSGYTLSRLGIARDNITPYYSMGGDEFSGVHDHGFSQQRIAAFNKGWQLAEWKRHESGASAMKGGAADSAASDELGETDDSAAATAAAP